MTDYTTPEQAEEGSREFAGGYHEGRLWAEEQAAIQARARELKIADLTAEAAKWQRLYLEAVSELAQANATIEDREQDCINVTHDWFRAVCLAKRLRGERAVVRSRLRALDLAAAVPQGD